MKRRTIPEGIRLTLPGAIYIGLALVVGIAAANTGNNALYLVEALLLTILVWSGITSRRNVSRLEIALDLPSDVHAKEPFTAAVTVENRDRWMARRLVVVEGLAEAEALLVPYLAPRADTQGTFNAMVTQRGRYQVPFVHVYSIFPFGFFRKGLRIRQEAEMLIYPELYPAGTELHGRSSRIGERPSRQRGDGNELFSLRDYREGDERRNIHWKQSARTGTLVLMEREAERSECLSIVLDNAVGKLEQEDERKQFEHLVSEAATAATVALEKGYEVELVTRDARHALARGPRQRRRIMETLALIDSCPRVSVPLESRERSVPQLKLGLEDRSLPPGEVA